MTRCQRRWSRTGNGKVGQAKDKRSIRYLKQTGKSNAHGGIALDSPEGCRQVACIEVRVVFSGDQGFAGEIASAVIDVDVVDHHCSSDCPLKTRLRLVKRKWKTAMLVGVNDFRCKASPRRVL